MKDRPPVPSCACTAATTRLTAARPGRLQRLSLSDMWRIPRRRRRAECAKQINRVVAVVPHRPRARANGRPDIFQGSFLPHPGFILEPDLDRFTLRRSGQRFLHQAGEVFLKASSASRSFFGWWGRGCSRVIPSWRNHLPMVCSHTVTDHRAAISSQRSIRRQPGDLDGLAHDRTSCASCQGSHRIEQPAIREGAESQALRALV